MFVGQTIPRKNIKLHGLFIVYSLYLLFHTINKDVAHWKTTKTTTFLNRNAHYFTLDTPKTGLSTRSITAKDFTYSAVQKYKPLAPI